MMLRSALGCVVAGMLVAGAAAASPEEDLAAMQQRFGQAFEGVPRDDYVFGTFMFNPAARAHYQDIMAFPPFLGDIERGRTLWETPLRSGKTYADCLPAGGRMIAGNYPYYEPAEDRVVTFEMALNRCRRANGEAGYRYDDRATMGVLTAYARSLSDGMRLDIRVDGDGARAKYEDGKRLFYRRVGQMNFSCATCHVHHAGSVMRMETISPAIGQATHFPIFRGGDVLYTQHMRFARCMEQVRAQPFAIGGEDFNNLEYFHAYLSNGLPLQASVYRR